ncbi:hypothetical protein AXG93_2415s1260 [Marchantia polymorpha subsp. ruderalis]|uniref:Uncharacterized protein n=1 Tax=Marchantia polymorpha subsp. ruderalis TaxID=1480154 RepID=A0A176VUV9_MARPO|nr:hypothetical protein AXG93_2415s1260 [Marchantia polymorpha subsp. ruderalis]
MLPAAQSLAPSCSAAHWHLSRALKSDRTAALDRGQLSSAQTRIVLVFGVINACTVLQSPTVSPETSSDPQRNRESGSSSSSKYWSPKARDRGSAGDTRANEGVSPDEDSVVGRVERSTD